MKGWAGEVADEEKLYRRVRQTVAGQVCYQTDGDRVHFSQSAFNDPAHEPSLDRASVRADPELARLSVEEGIVALQATAIRHVGPVPKIGTNNKAAKDSEGRPIEHVIDVVSDPKFGNCSHAVVTVNPAMGSGAFRRLKDRLARLASDAGWTIKPGTPTTGQRENALQDSIRCLRHRFAGHI